MKTTDRHELESLRLSLARIAQALGVEHPYLEDPLQACQTEDRGWNDLAGECVMKIGELKGVDQPVEHHLFAKDGSLFAPLTDRTRGPDAGPDDKERMLIVVYPEGDCDNCPWPIEDEEHARRLEGALFDEGNLGYLEPGRVFLPDGQLFGQIVPCGFNRK